MSIYKEPPKATSLKEHIEECTRLVYTYPPFDFEKKWEEESKPLLLKGIEQQIKIRRHDLVLASNDFRYGSDYKHKWFFGVEAVKGSYLDFCMKKLQKEGLKVSLKKNDEYSTGVLLRISWK